MTERTLGDFSQRSAALERFSASRNRHVQFPAASGATGIACDIKSEIRIRNRNLVHLGIPLSSVLLLLKPCFLAEIRHLTRILRISADPQNLQFYGSHLRCEHLLSRLLKQLSVLRSRMRWRDGHLCSKESPLFSMARIASIREISVFVKFLVLFPFLPPFNFPFQRSVNGGFIITITLPFSLHLFRSHSSLLMVPFPVLLSVPLSLRRPF